MGSANNWIEENIGGVSLFINGDAGDINPVFSVACNGGPVFSGGEVIVRQLCSFSSRCINVDRNANREPPFRN